MACTTLEAASTGDRASPEGSRRTEKNDKAEIVTDRAAAPDYRISPAAPLASELARIGRSEIAFAHCLATRIASDPVYSIHQCRKAIKRLRALIRLGRKGNRDTARALDRKLRDAGRMLAAARDAGVIAATAASLGRDDASQPPMDCQYSLAQTDLNEEETKEVARQLAGLQNDLDEFTSSDGRSVDDLSDAIEREFRAMKRAKRRFRDSGRKRDAHEWRKIVQRCTNQLKLAGSLLPWLAADQLVRLDALAQTLGDFNDLTILQQALKSGRLDIGKNAAKELRRRARVRQEELKTQAFKAGRSIGV